MKNEKTLGVIQILLSLIAGICYPLMLKEGVFDGNWYGIIGAAVAIYGGLKSVSKKSNSSLQRGLAELRIKII